jgi:hypothetical protein
MSKLMKIGRNGFKVCIRNTGMMRITLMAVRSGRLHSIHNTKFSIKRDLLWLHRFTINDRHGGIQRRITTRLRTGSKNIIEKAATTKDINLMNNINLMKDISLKKDINILDLCNTPLA